MRRLALPGVIRDWSLRSLQVKLIEIGSRMVSHARRIILQMAVAKRRLAWARGGSAKRRFCSGAGTYRPPTLRLQLTRPRCRSGTK